MKPIFAILGDYDGVGQLKSQDGWSHLGQRVHGAKGSSEVFT
jgi:hypothetical protein